MAARASETGITYVAFTATPKTKTMELFGRRPDLSRPAGPDNLPAPFHMYSMRQAIEEGFILDVLRNYTPYRLTFRLAHGGRDHDEKAVERSAAMKGITGWVRLHPYNIVQKVEIVVEHFRDHVMSLLGGRAAQIRSRNTASPQPTPQGARAEEPRHTADDAFGRQAVPRANRRRRQRARARGRRFLSEIIEKINTTGIIDTIMDDGRAFGDEPPGAGLGEDS